MPDLNEKAMTREEIDHELAAVRRDIEAIKTEDWKVTVTVTLDVREPMTWPDAMLAAATKLLLDHGPLRTGEVEVTGAVKEVEAA